MSLIIKEMSLPKHADVNGEKDTAYRCVVLAHPDNTVELVIDTEFASPYDNGHNIQRYPLTEIPTPHGRLIDADRVLRDNADFADREVIHPSIQVTLRDFLDDAPTVIEADVK